MRIVTTPRIALARELRDEFLHNQRSGRRLIAVEGEPGSGAAGVADDLRAVFEEAGIAAFRASIADFLSVPDDGPARDILPDSSPGTIDEPLLRRVLIDPFRLGGSAGFQLAGFDAARGIPAESAWVTAPKDAVVVVDGHGLLSRSLAGVWHWSIHTEAPGRAEADPASRRLAVAIIDTTDEEHPRRRYADSC